MGAAEKTDVDLLAGIKARDVDALGLLYDRYSSVLLPLAFRILRSRTEAEEVVHDAFLAAWERADQYTPQRGNVASWLIVLARNLSIDRARRRQRRGRIDRDALAHEPATPPPDPENVARATRARETVQRVLDEVPVPQRQFLMAIFFEGLTYDEIARREGVPLGTIKSRAARAFASLRESFVQKGISPDDLL